MKIINSKILWAFWCLILWSCSSIPTPDVSAYTLEIPKVEKSNDSTFLFKNNFLAKNKHGLYEFYNHGNALQMGYNHGALAEPLMLRQESAFFSKVEEIVPSKSRQTLLSKILKWYARKMAENILPEYQAEIFGVSRYASDQYNFIADAYPRMLYLHAAHDIGHAMQDLMLVGCSSLAVWDGHSEDGSLLIGRNFDFYVGDEFSKRKMVNFVKPEKGIPFMSVSWPGMIGVASGMNSVGISVTINAGKSKIPLSAKTPISLVTREILQYATNIQEAIAIAKKRKVFVSESILVGSAQDRKAVIIEVSPDNFGVYEPENLGKLVCTNHFQSSPYQTDRRNQKQIRVSHSEYRFEKINEEIAAQDKFNPKKIAALLRDTSGVKNEVLGFGNEKAVNQLLAHHSVIFSPEKRLVWVSSDPYNLGEMVCYDLNKIFNEEHFSTTLATDSLNISRDSFADSAQFKNYEKYRIADREIDRAFSTGKSLDDKTIEDYIALNPDLWIVHYKAGKYYFDKNDFVKARYHLENSLQKVISSVPERKNVEKYLKKTKARLRP